MTIEVLVAGPWADHTALATAFMTKHSLKWLVTESLLEEKETGHTCQLSVEEADDALRERLADATDLSPTVLAKVAGMVALRLPDGGIEAAQDLAYFAHQLIRLGGIAVVVTGAGKVLDAETWESRWDNEEASGLYSLFVALREEDDFYYSYGMHQFGYADAACRSKLDYSEATWLIHAFNLARMTGEIKAEPTSFETEDDLMKVRKIPSPVEDQEHPTFNSYGVLAVG